jgi:dTDP-4-dehydrorhamnose 3,5-epimerase
MATVDNKFLLNHAIQDGQMANPDGTPVFKLPVGATLHELPCHPDDRGIVCELFDPRWRHLEHPFEFCYFWTLKPKVAKGWALHLEHSDRYCIVNGEMLTVLYDGREDSETFGRSFEVFMSDRRRRMLLIPPGVWHADLNLGNTETLVVNFPTIKYNHAKPDKYRLPLNTDLIPYKIPTELRGY